MAAASPPPRGKKVPDISSVPSIKRRQAPPPTSLRLFPQCTPSGTWRWGGPPAGPRGRSRRGASSPPSRAGTPLAVQRPQPTAERESAAAPSPSARGWGDGCPGDHARRVRRGWLQGVGGGVREAGSGGGWERRAPADCVGDNCRKWPVRSFRGSPAPARTLEGRGPRRGREDRRGPPGTAAAPELSVGPRTLPSGGRPRVREELGKPLPRGGGCGERGLRPREAGFPGCPAERGWGCGAAAGFPWRRIAVKTTVIVGIPLSLAGDKGSRTVSSAAT